MARTEATLKKRANGVESRQRILDATVRIAGERGYEGTSIAAVSADCGLPASSICWHFKDKDDLIAAVIERSFETWLAAVELPGEETGTPRERATAMAASVATSLVDAPDFLRLGLMLEEDALHTLTTYAVAGADGLFVHREIHGDAVDLVAMFELHARLVHDAAIRLATRSKG